MKLSIRKLALLPCLAAFVALTGIAHADPITGIIYTNTPDASNAGNSANMSSSLPNATFTVGAGGINFQSPPAAYTANGFLNSPGFSNVHNGFDPNSTSQFSNAEVVLTGTIFLNAGANTTKIGHDDGVVLSIPGISYSSGSSLAGPTSFSLSTLTINNPGAAGNYTFTLDYAECCTPPADLEWVVNGAPLGSTPEPNSIILLGSGLLAAAGVVRRRFVK